MIIMINFINIEIKEIMKNKFVKIFIIKLNFTTNFFNVFLFLKIKKFYHYLINVEKKK